MKQAFILVLAAALSLTTRQMTVSVPTSTPTATQTLPPTPTAISTLSPTPEIMRIGGIMKMDWYATLQRWPGPAFSMPVECLCVNMDGDLYQASLEAEQASMIDNPGHLGGNLEGLIWLANNRLCRFIPDTQSFKNFREWMRSWAFLLIYP